MSTALEKLLERRQQAEERAAARKRKELSKIHSEKLVASHLVKCTKEKSGLIFKQHPLTNVGIPDYLVIMCGRTMFVETKTSGEVCTPIQVEFHKMLRDKGIETYVLDTKIDDFYDLYKYGYKTYVAADDPKYGINKVKNFRNGK